MKNLLKSGEAIFDFTRYHVYILIGLQNRRKVVCDPHIHHEKPTRKSIYAIKNNFDTVLVLANAINDHQR